MTEAAPQPPQFLVPPVGGVPGPHSTGSRSGALSGAGLLHPAPQVLRTDPELPGDLDHRPARRPHEFDRVPLALAEYRFVHCLST